MNYRPSHPYKGVSHPCDRLVFALKVMKSELRYISLSHSKAPVALRQRYSIPEADRRPLAGRIQARFADIRGLLILTTCNRFECWFESAHTPASSLRDFLVDITEGAHPGETCRDRFELSDRTDESVKHLFRVAAGLESAVLGDAEILNQIKKAFLQSADWNLQGSLLERSLQSVFRLHKRISNETAFRDGTTSTAYKALKTISDLFGPRAAGEKKILLVGAGDIIRQVFKYNDKFQFEHLYVTNRTAEKAESLARTHGAKAWPWPKLLAGELDAFDVIISAVSHMPGLIRSGWAEDRQVLLIDLAVPGNIAPDREPNPSVVHFDLDAIAAQLQQTQENRLKATGRVEEILEEERTLYAEWFEKQPLRRQLAAWKPRVRAAVATRGAEPGEIRLQTSRIMRQLARNPELLDTPARIEMLIDEFCGQPVA